MAVIKMQSFFFTDTYIRSEKISPPNNFSHRELVASQKIRENKVHWLLNKFVPAQNQLEMAAVNFGTSVRHSSGRQTAGNDVVATKNDILFFFPVVYFSHRRNAQIKKHI